MARMLRGALAVGPVESGPMVLGPAPPAARRSRGQRQSLSFVLTLPLFILVMLTLVQISQVMIGRMVVQYAAFAAARSAIVWVPARLPGEPENWLPTYAPADDPSAALVGPAAGLDAARRGR